MKVYKAIALPTLLYGSETWVAYSHNLKSLEKFHDSCARKILGIKWQDYQTTDSVFDKANTTSIEAIVVKSQLRWSGHVFHMPDTCLPKQIMYSEVEDVKHTRGGQRKWYKDTLHRSLKECSIRTKTGERLGLTEMLGSYQFTMRWKSLRRTKEAKGKKRELLAKPANQWPHHQNRAIPALTVTRYADLRLDSPAIWEYTASKQTSNSNFEGLQTHTHTHTRTHARTRAHTHKHTPLSLTAPLLQHFLMRPVCAVTGRGKYSRFTGVKIMPLPIQPLYRCQKLPHSFSNHETRACSAIVQRDLLAANQLPKIAS